MKPGEIPEQGELFAFFWQKPPPFRLRVNDVIRFDGKLGRIIRINDCAAVVVVRRPPRAFKTRFDKPVRLQPSPRTFRISVNSEVEILNRVDRKRRKPQRKEQK